MAKVKLSWPYTDMDNDRLSYQYKENPTPPCPWKKSQLYPDAGLKASGKKEKALRKGALCHAVPSFLNSQCDCPA